MRLLAFNVSGSPPRAAMTPSRSGCVTSDGISDVKAANEHAIACRTERALRAADRVTLTRTAAYTCTQTAVECYSLKGEYQWKRDYAAAPQAVLESKQLLVFTGDLIEVCQMPAEESTNG